MIKTAVLRAVAGEDTGVNRREVEVVRDPGQRITAEVECRDIEAVNDVSRLEDYLCGLTERQDELRVLRGGRVTRKNGGTGLRSLHQRDLFSLGVAVAEAPPPLESGDPDRDGRMRSEGVNGVLSLDRVEEDHTDDDQRHGGVDDLHKRIAVELARHLVRVAPAVGDHGPKDQAPNDRCDDKAGHRHPGPQLELRLALSRGTPKATKGGQRAATERKRDSAEQQKARDPP